jgi:uncharacterized protein
MTDTITTDARSVTAAFYGAMGAKDVDALLALMDDDIAVEIPGQSGIAGSFRGKEATLGLLGTLSELSEGTYTFDVQTITASQGVAAAVGRATGSARGKDLDQEVVHVLDIADGRVAKLQCFFGNQAMTDEFWS